MTTDADALASLEVRLAGVAQLRTAPSFDALRLRFRLHDLGASDTLVLDLRRTPARETERIVAYLSERPLTCRLLMLDPAQPGETPIPEAILGSARITATMEEPVDAYAAALHFGEGLHGVLIAAMRALAPHLSDIGRRFVYDVLAERFACRTVSAVAERWDMHRTRLHHLLLHRGDPTPKHLFDWCHTMVAALLVRHTKMPSRDLARFSRVRHPRVLGEAIRRRTGLTLARFRSQVLLSTHVDIRDMVRQHIRQNSPSEAA